MGVDVTTYRIRIGCCRHIYGNDVVRETITVNVAMVSKSAITVLLLLLTTLGLTSTLQCRFECKEDDYVQCYSRVAFGALYFIQSQCTGKSVPSERVIGALIFIQLLLLIAGVEPNPGPELQMSDTIAINEMEHIPLIAGIILRCATFFSDMTYGENRDVKARLHNAFNFVYTLCCGITITPTNLLGMIRSCFYLLGNKGAHMTNGNPHDQGDVEINPLRDILREKVHCSVGFIRIGKLNEDQMILSHDGFSDHGTGFRVGDCFMMTAFHVLRDRIDDLIGRIAFKLQQINVKELPWPLTMGDSDSFENPKDIIENFLEKKAFDVELLMSYLNNYISEEFETHESNRWNKNCIVDFIDDQNSIKRFGIDWRIVFGCKVSDVLIVKLLQTCDGQVMPPRLNLADKYVKTKKMCIVRFIDEDKPVIVVDKECEVLSDDNLNTGVTLASEWWESTFPDEDNSFEYKDCTIAHNAGTGRVIVRAAVSFVKGSSGSPVVYFDEEIAFVGMIYQKGFPAFYYDNETYWQKKIQAKHDQTVKNSVLFEGCTTMKKVAELLTQYKKTDLKEEIFNKMEIHHHSALKIVSDSLQKANHMSLFSTSAEEDPETDEMDLEILKEETEHMIFRVLQKKIEKQTERKVQKWQEEEEYFVETKATKCITSRLRDSRILTIVGCSGSGKSAAMHHAALKLRQENFTLIVLRNYIDVQTYIPKKNQVCVIDDPIGNSKLDETKLKIWSDHIKSLPKCKSMKVIATIHSEIYNCIKEGSDLNTNIIDMHSDDLKMLPYDRLMFFEQALQKRNILVVENTTSLMRLIEACETHFFPQLVNMYFKDAYFRDNPSQLFIEFQGAFERRLEQLCKHNHDQFAGLVLCAVKKDKLQTSSLFSNNHFTPRMHQYTELLNSLGISTTLMNIRVALNMLEGVYITETDKHYRFKHKEFKDIVSLFVGKKYDTFISKYCDTPFCLKRCKLPRTPHNVYSSLLNKDRKNTKSEKYMITINKDSEKNLAVKFIKSIEENEDMGACIFESDFCQDRMFLETLYSEISYGEPGIKAKVLFQILCNACLNSFEDLIQKLLSETFDLRSVCFTGLTPLAACAYAGHTTYLKHFVKHGCSVNTEFKGYTPLALATLNQKLDTATDLLDYGCDIDAGYYTPLSLSALNSDEKMATLLLDRKADVNKLDGAGLSPLTNAVYSEKITNLFLKNCANVNKHDEKKNSFTPLSVASILGTRGIVDILLENEAEVNTLDKLGNTSLTVSIIGGNKKIANLLIQNERVNVNEKGPGEKAVTPLCAACKKGYIDTVELLVDNHADINTFCGKGSTPLTWAVSESNEDIIYFLLKKKADVNICGENIYALTPLTSASVTGSLKILNQLIINDADIDKCNGAGRTALTQAVLKNNIELVTFLLEKDANVNIFGKCSKAPTPLTAASTNGYTEIVDRILKKQPKINLQDGGGETALTCASNTGSNDVVERLLRHRADIDVFDAMGRTPLTRSILSNKIDTSNLLLENNADVNISGKGEHAFSPITAASFTGSTEMVSVLIKYEVKLTELDGRGKTALETAIESGNTNMVRNLEEEIDKFQEREQRKQDADSNQHMGLKPELDWHDLCQALCTGQSSHYHPPVNLQFDSRDNPTVNDGRIYTPLHRQHENCRLS